MTRVVHCKKEPFDVYIGRPSKWGNPYIIGVDGERDQVLLLYEAYVRSTPELMDSLHELEGKVLGCWCHPKPCHGDVLIRLMEEKAPERGERGLSQKRGTRWKRPSAGGLRKDLDRLNDNTK